MEVDALLDSGATGLFINRTSVQKKGIHMQQLEHLITVYNIDGSMGIRVCTWFLKICKV
jgi:predicted aspartyl protease